MTVAVTSRDQHHAAADRSVLPSCVRGAAGRFLAGRQEVLWFSRMDDTSCWKHFLLLLLLVLWNMLSLHSYCTDVAAALPPLLLCCCKGVKVKGL